MGSGAGPAPRVRVTGALRPGALPGTGGAGAIHDEEGESPEFIISAFNYGADIHWGDKRETVALWDHDVFMSPHQQMRFFKSAVSLAYIYLGLSELVEAALQPGPAQGSGPAPSTPTAGLRPEAPANGASHARSGAPGGPSQRPLLPLAERSLGYWRLRTSNREGLLLSIWSSVLVAISPQSVAKGSSARVGG